MRFQSESEQFLERSVGEVWSAVNTDQMTGIHSQVKVTVDDASIKILSCVFSFENFRDVSCIFCLEATAILSMQESIVCPKFEVS